MGRKQYDLPPLYVTAELNDQGNVERFPQGGGSSTIARIKAFDNIDSAKRSARMNKAHVLRVTDGEVMN